MRVVVGAVAGGGVVRARHGTDYSYTTLCCRCDDCITGYRAARQAREARLRAEGFPGRTHGRPGTYRVGCRCAPCRMAQAESNRASRQRHPERYARAEKLRNIRRARLRSEAAVAS